MKTILRRRNAGDTMAFVLLIASAVVAFFSIIWTFGIA